MGELTAYLGSMNGSLTATTFTSPCSTLERTDLISLVVFLAKAALLWRWGTYALRKTWDSFSSIIFMDEAGRTYDATNATEPVDSNLND